jgi:hypothetical protein
MTNYIIPIIALSILLVGATYKLLTKKDNTTEKEEVKETHKENTIPKSVINDHIAEIMNVKKDK